MFWAKFARAGRALNAGQICTSLVKLERHLARPKNSPDTPIDAFTYLRAMVDDSSDERLAQTWREAMVGLDGVQAYQYPWGNKNKAKKLRELAKDSRVLHAFQASAVACETSRVTFGARSRQRTQGLSCVAVRIKFLHDAREDGGR